MNEQNTNTEQKTKKERRKECVIEIKDTIRLLGAWSVNRLSLSKKYEVEWRTVDSWFRQCLQDIPREAVQNIKVMGETGIKKSMMTCERIISDPESSRSEKLKAIGIMNETLKHFTTFLEDYGDKKRVAEKISIDGLGDLMSCWETEEKKDE